MNLSRSIIQNKLNKFTRYQNIEFGNFMLNEQERALVYDGQHTQLREKLFWVFCFLIQSKGRLVPRGLLIETIWNANYNVGQSSLTHSICMLRELLLVDPKASVEIVTVPKVGYKLIVQE